MIWLNGEPTQSPLAADRGLQYGDGVFETIAVKAGRALLLEEHLQRLTTGLERLELSGIDIAALRDEIRAAITGTETGVLKVIVTGGATARGYARSSDTVPTRILSLHDLPGHPVEYWGDGISLKICETRLGRNPKLAGIKHLNRLEQVLARGEWDSSDIADGVMLDIEDNAIETVNGNLFIVFGDTVLTPCLAHSGVAGVMRAAVLDACEKRQQKIEIRAFTTHELLAADEVFVTNSVIGVWPVNKVDDVSFRVGTVTSQILQAVKPHIPYAL